MPPLSDAWEAAPIGLAVLAPDGRVQHLNAAGREVLSGTDPAAVFDGDTRIELARAGAERIIDCRVSGEHRSLACRISTQGESEVVAFRDITKQRRQQRRIAAVASTAASVASERSLAVSLGAIAREVARADGLAGVQILAAERGPEAGLKVMGSAGFPASPEFFELLLRCRDNGAALKMLETYQTGRPVVIRNRYQAVMNDPAWAPLHDYLRAPEWDSFVSMPLLVGRQPVGVLNAFFSPGQEVDDDVQTFLSTMADQAALAVDYAELLEQQRHDAGRAERQRLARELHDSVVQQVFSIGMQTEALKLLSQRDEPNWAQVTPVALELESMSRSVLADLRSLVAQLHPTTPTSDGLSQALAELVSTTRRRTDIAVDLSCPTSVDDLSDALSEDVYFVIAEAVHNAVKHAAPSTIDLVVSHDERKNQLEVVVADDGRGIEDSAERSDGGYGLVSMRERVENWSGTLEIAPLDEGGTRVTLRLPTSTIGRRQVIGVRT